MIRTTIDDLGNTINETRSQYDDCTWLQSLVPETRSLFDYFGGNIVILVFVRMAQKGY